jgi:formyltetrahydrofolate deformylase
MRHTAVLLIDCPDRKGLVAGVANLLYRYGANITHADQHQDPLAELFFMRVEWELEGFDLPKFREDFQLLADELHMRWSLHLMSQPPRVAIFVSQYCTAWRTCYTAIRPAKSAASIPLIVSNHPQGEALANFYGIRFHHIPIDPANRRDAEEKQLRLLAESRVDLIVLARYMQILSAGLRRSNIPRESSTCTIPSCRLSSERVPTTPRFTAASN